MSAKFRGSAEASPRFAYALILTHSASIQDQCPFLQDSFLLFLYTVSDPHYLEVDCAQIGYGNKCVTGVVASQDRTHCYKTRQHSTAKLPCHF